MRVLRFLLLAIVLGAVGAFWWTSRTPAPDLEATTSTAVVGQESTLNVVVDTHGGQLSQLDIALEQGGTVTPLFALPGNEETKLTQLDANRIQLTRAIGRKAVATLKDGSAVVHVTATTPITFGWRARTSSLSKALTVRLTPPRVSVLSSFHFVNHGGSEMVVYRVTPADAASGVRVGDVRYAGYPASAAGVAGADPSLKVAFFALLHDQDLGTPMTVYAQDDAGNAGTAAVEVRVFPKPFRRSRIEIDDAFLSRVVPAIEQGSPNFAFHDASDLLGSYLQINGDMRAENDETLKALADKTAPQKLWEGPFKQLTNSQVEASFADHRTYYYKGKEIDQRVHLGFDLAVTSGVAVTAANRGIVTWANFLGIYGNCVVIDHGMGVQSLYAHLSSIEVKEGDKVERDQPLGRSGQTGLAGGDHLHFTMLVGGHAVNPVDWWSAQWIEDRLMRKLREAQSPTADTPSSSTPTAASSAPAVRASGSGAGAGRSPKSRRGRTGR
ncbi:MAG: M23 family metallopeptidase [Vicinamibacterales bacterium]